MTHCSMIANIGQRDLVVDCDVVAERDAKLAEKLRAAVSNKNLRVLGALVLDHFDAVEPALAAPMLERTLRDVAARDAAPKVVLLPGTKQKDKRFMAGDTFRCAEALARLLRVRFPEIERVSALTVTGAPNDLDAMLPAYADVCRDATAQRVYALCTGGTPACNMALSLRAIEQFGEGCAVLHVAEGAEAPTYLGIGRYIFAQHRHAALERLAARGDFDAIAEDTGYAEPVRLLARAAATRLNFNFKESLSVLHRIKQPAIEGAVKTLIEEGTVLASENNRCAALREVYWNAVLKWRRDECTDFLGRVWRLLEGTLHTLMLPLLGAPEHNRIWTAFESWTRNQPQAYRDYLQHKIAKNVPPRPYYGPTMPVLSCTLGYLLKHDATSLARTGFGHAAATQLKTVVNALRPLTDLRNGSVMAHGFGGVWKGGILATVGAGEDETVLLGQLRELLVCQGIETGSDPYGLFAEALSLLNREIDYDAD